ncbi:hypothetical protein [Microbacterium profundi]|uniref:hypothetical protein n=1 Tax=Microbacterium profundi TaxID=450380 RepID=UPI001269C19A|nr:hypothetical protein [Microbacterium profundi]
MALYGIRTVGGLFVVDVAAGLVIQAPFTITPVGQPGWQPAMLSLDTLQGDPVRPIDNEEVLDEIAFWGGILRSENTADGERILWCVRLRVHEYDPLHAGLVVAGGFVFAREEMTSFNRLQPGGASARMPDIRAVLGRYADDESVLAFEVPRGFVLTPGRRGRADAPGQIPAELEAVTLFVTASGSMHAISAAGYWSKITSRSHAVPAESGSWHSALVAAVPTSVVITADSVGEAIQHPDSRRGVEQVTLGDHLYVHTRASWTLTTPIVRILAGILVDRVDDRGTYVVAGPDAAWIVEDSMLLPVHDGDILPAPVFLAVGDRVGNSVITCVVRLDESTVPTTAA